MAVFNDVLGENKNQLFVTREEDAPITAEQLLAPCEGERTEEGMRANIRVRCSTSKRGSPVTAAYRFTV
jgi:Malate synthase